MLLYSCTELEAPFPIDSSGLTVFQDGQYIDDQFIHEQYLLIEENEKRILISGCSHKGIVNIASYFNPDVLVGGFHLNKQENEETLAEIADLLLQGKTNYYTGHCTGSKQYDYLKHILADRLQNLSTGLVIEA